jgi:hypothetical protein
MNETKKLYFEITNINLLKILVDVLDKTCEDVRWNFLNTQGKKNKNNDLNNSLEISCTTSTKNCFIKTKFNEEFIKKLFIESDKFEILINVKKILNILKSVDKTDSLLKFYIEKKKSNKTKSNNNLDLDLDSDLDSNSESDSNSDSNQDIMIIEISSLEEETNYNGLNDSDSDSDSDKKNKKKINLKSVSKIKKIVKNKKFSIDIFYPVHLEKQIAKINFDKKITIGCEKFHKACKDLGTLFDFVKITSKNNKLLSFSCDNDNCDGVNGFKFDDEIKLENLNGNIITTNGIYSLEDINIFSKLSDISTEFYFQIKNNFVLECNYKFDKYGYADIIYVNIKDDGIKNISNSFANPIINLENSDNMSNISDINNLEFKSPKVKKTIDDKIIYLEIDQIELFKLLCECTEKIISEPLWTINCIEQTNPSIQVSCSNNSKNINIEYKIKNIFSQYKQLDKPIELGINLDKLNDVLKTIGKTDRLVLSIDKNDKHNLTIQVKNKEKINHKKIYKIKLLNVEDNSVHLRKDYIKKITIDSDEFYKICKEVNSIGEVIKLECSNKHVSFSCMEESKYLNMYKKNSDSVKIINVDSHDTNINPIINNDLNKSSSTEGAYEIKDLMIFSKLINFMEDFKFNLSVDGMLTLESDFVSRDESNPLELGSIKIQYISKTKQEIPTNDIKMIESDVEYIQDKLLFFKLKKINFMKIIIDTIEKLVLDVDWVFTSLNKPYQKTNTNEFVGLEIICTDPSKTLYVKTKLSDSVFKSYHCRKQVFRFGMSLEFFNKILKLTDKNDVAIYCYIEESDPANMIIRFKNPENKNKKIFKIPLQILTPDPKPPITLGFEKKITMGLNKFQEICKKINNNSQFIEIDCDGELINFNCVGESKGTIPFDNTDDNDFKIINLNGTNTKGIYETKNILLFSKLTSICDEFSFFMKNNFALTSIYSFGEYGSITTILSPINESHINNLEYDYSDDEDDVELIKTNTNTLDFF